MALIAPRVVPALDPQFRPAALAHRSFLQQTRAVPDAMRTVLALEQGPGSVCRFTADLFPSRHPLAAQNELFLVRLVKVLLWSRGGYRLFFSGPAALADRLRGYFRDSAAGQFDAHLIAGRVYDHDLEVVTAAAADIPPEHAPTQSLGRHIEGCRIGFDLGGSDRKVAAVRDGRVVFSEERAWSPGSQADPQYHFDGIMDSLKRAAAHLPRVDAIGGSAAGVYVRNRVKVASLFRGVPPGLFERRVRGLFLDVQKAWGGVPLEVMNDGEVAALAGSMELGANAVLGLALGTSLAAGYITRAGDITSWLNELAFVPVDYAPDAPRDEWSGDRGCGAQYLSQQAVGRLMYAAGIGAGNGRTLPGQLQHLQNAIAEGDERARKVYQTIGTYLGYAIAQYAAFYDVDHVLLLGRVTTGPGGDMLVAGAREVLQAEFPELARIAFHLPDEKHKRHGQAIAAASLPELPCALSWCGRTAKVHRRQWRTGTQNTLPGRPSIP